MLLAILFSLVGHVDVVLPMGPSVIGTADLQVRGGASSKIFILNAKTRSLTSMTQTEITNRDVKISDLPDSAVLGPRSLFYMKADTSTEFVFTDQARTYVYYGTNASGSPAVSSLSCGPYQEISDIHITETVAGTTSKLIVADKKANTVYSYTLTPSGSALCSSAASFSVNSPLWIQSSAQADPTLYIGYQSSSGLTIRSYQQSTMSALTAAEVVSPNRRAQFGKVFYEADSSELFVPIMYHDNAIASSSDPLLGNDYVRHYNSGFTSSTTFSTCRAPVQMARDFEGGSRYRYVLCPADRIIKIYNTSDTLVKTVSAGSAAVKMLVGSDGTNRYIAVLQTDNKLVLHKAAIASNPTNLFTSTTLTLSSAMNDIGHFGSLDYAVLVSANSNTVTFVNLSTQAVSDTLYHPNSVDSMVAQSSTVAHFVSTSANSAYTLTELSSAAWRLRHFNVGTSPVQIGYRTNRLYALNRGSNTLSVINLTSNAVSSINTQTRPVHFDFNTTVDRLWAVNETSQSLTTINITSGSEVFVSNTALGFTPKKVVYQSADTPATLYVGGSNKVRTLTAATLATAATHTLPGNFTDMVRLSTGAAASSTGGVSLSTLTPSTISSTTLDSPPHFLTGNGTIAVAGLLADSSLVTSSSLEKTIQPFSRIFSTGAASTSSVAAYMASQKKLALHPINLFSSTTFPSTAVTIDVDPAVTAYDGSGNIWMADLGTPRIQRLTSAFQRESLASVLNNTTSDIKAWTAKGRIYATLRSVNAVAVLDPATPTLSVYSVCASPRELALDSVNLQLYALCTESDSVSVLTLNSSGDVTAESLLGTQKRPVSMKINTGNNRLYIANMNSDSVTIINTATNATITNATVNTAPVDMVINAGSNAVSVVHEGSTYLSTINGATNAVTSTDIGYTGLREITINPTSFVLYALSPATKAMYTSLTTGFTLASNLAENSTPGHAATTLGTVYLKTYVTYPAVDVVRIYNESGSSTDVSVGSNPLFSYAVDSATKTFVTNFSDDTVTVLNMNTNAVTTTVSLTSGCGPTKMTDITISGTKYLYVVCQSNDTLEVINTSTNAVGTPVSLRF